MTDETGPEMPPHHIVEALQQRWFQFPPASVALGLKLIRIERGKVWGCAPFRADLVGDVESNFLAGGVITTLLDHVTGSSVLASLDQIISLATIDMRIDYMRPAGAGADIMSMGHCYKITRSIAFVRAIAYEDDPEHPVAHAIGAYMMGANQGRAPGANLRSKGAGA